MTPYLDDGDVQLYHGDVCDVLRSLPAGAAQTCVTSPPYWGLRDYGEAGQIGLEPTPDEYVANMVAVFREVWRVLRDDGTLWLNLGDSYAGSPHWMGNSGVEGGANDGGAPPRTALTGAGLKPKDLVGVPWRVAFALQADGWYLRSDLIWAKPNPMPESVTDRPTKAHEYVFLFSKRPRYFYDADAVREPHDERYAQRRFSPQSKARAAGIVPDGWGPHNGFRTARSDVPTTFGHPAGRNLRSVWEIATEPFPEAHFATYPQALVRRCILAGTSERGECSACGAPWRREAERIETKAGEEYDSRMARAGVDFTPLNQPNRSMEQVPIRYNISQSRRETTGWRPSCECEAPTRPQLVLDPFIGSGTTALVARKHGRRCIGIDLSADYLKIAAGRLSQLSLLAGDSA